MSLILTSLAFKAISARFKLFPLLKGGTIEDMRIKERPEEFVVYEVADIAPEGQGEHALYRLVKRGATTWDVLGDVARRLRLRADALKYGGLKDRQALSFQFITIKHGPRKDLQGKNYRLEYLGQTTQPMSKARLLGNRFRILVKGVSTAHLKHEVPRVKRWGVVNYFDEQRFGSVRQGQGFAAREIILGNYERALYLMLVEGSQYEMARTRKFRACLRKSWPQVGDCLALSPSPWEKRLLEFLRQHRPSKRTFKRALALVDKEYLLLLCQAYQAYIWNETTKLYLQSLGLELFSIPYLLGELLFYRSIPEGLWKTIAQQKLPLPSPRLRLDPPFKALMESVLKKEGIESLHKFRSLVKGALFKTYPRPLVVIPEGLTYETVGPEQVWVEFFLPKGSYATIVLRRLFGLNPER